MSTKAMRQKVVAKVKMSQEIRMCIPLIFGVFILFMFGVGQVA
jgi:hypothetical protein